MRSNVQFANSLSGLRVSVMNSLVKIIITTETQSALRRELAELRSPQK